MVNDQSTTDQLKLTYLVSQNDLYGRPKGPLIGRPKILDMSNILFKNPDDQLIHRSLYTSVGPFLVGSSNTKVCRPVELCFLSLNDRTTSLPDPTINLYTSGVDLINFHRLVEPGL